MPLAMIEGSNFFFTHPDHLNTPQRVTDINQSVIWSHSHKPFGETVEEINVPPELAISIEGKGKIQAAVRGGNATSVIQTSDDLQHWVPIATNSAPFAFSITSDAQTTFFRTVSHPATSQITVNLRYPGQYVDVESVSIYNMMRTYNATTGRFEEFDPIGFNGDINPYAYVSSNPIMWADPSGLDKTVWWPDHGRSFADGPRNGNWGHSHPTGI